MSILDFFRAKPRPTAPQAKERLQILLAHERASLKAPEYLPKLCHDILEVVGRYVEIDTDKVSVQVENVGNIAKLELNIELPNTPAPLRQAG